MQSHHIPALLPPSPLEELLHCDPCGRRLPAARHLGNYLDAGQLEQAAESLAAAKSVAIVTGFCTLSANPPAAETDGPPGALYLARALMALGIRVQLITDCYGEPVLRAGCRYWKLPEGMTVVAPWRRQRGSSKCKRWCIDRVYLNDWTHLVAIERPGPSRDGLCYNMRGGVILGATAPLHVLFDAAQFTRRTALDCGISTIGIADGGNEIGIGKLPRQDVRDALGDPALDKIICSVPTDYLLLAGVSNWAAYALAGCVCAMRGRKDLIAGWSVEDHGRMIEALVRDGGAVDGTTGRREATVDGLPLPDYLQTLTEIQRLLLR